MGSEECLASSADQLPLAFQVCSVRLGGQGSQPCWSREQAHQSTAHRVCSAPAARATEDKWKTTVIRTTATSNATGSRAPGVPLRTYLLLLDARLLLYSRQYLGHVGFEHHPAHDQLGQDEMDLVHSRWLVTGQWSSSRCRTFPGFQRVPPHPSSPGLTMTCASNGYFMVCGKKITPVKSMTAFSVQHYISSESNVSKQKNRNTAAQVIHAALGARRHEIFEYVST